MTSRNNLGKRSNSTVTDLSALYEESPPITDDVYLYNNIALLAGTVMSVDCVPRPFSRHTIASDTVRPVLLAPLVL